MEAECETESIPLEPHPTRFTVRIDFLNRPSLADTTRRGRVEWPPHPHRLFAAMTAAHYEAEVGRRETLEWMERQHPPAIAAPALHDRASGTHFVPVNDEISAKSFEKSSSDLPLGDRRIRQERVFTAGSILPSPARDRSDEGSVFYTWTTAEPPPEDLDDILFAVTRLGHSSSLVAASLCTSASPPPNWIPTEGGEFQLRVSVAGTLAQLDELHEVRNLPTRQQDRRKPALKPDAWASYRRVRRTSPVRAPWREWWAWSLEPRIAVTAWIHLAEAIRGTLLRSLPEDASEVLSGHSHGNHLAVVPLTHVGHPKADAAILGFAILAPELLEQDRLELLVALARLDEAARLRGILAGPAGHFSAESVKAHELRRTLRREAWSAPAREWATVTPIVLDLFPKGNLAAERIVAESAARLGLPPPSEVRLAREGFVAGSPASYQFRVRRPAGSPSRRPDRRPWTHALLRWEQAIEGPLVLGAMRHFGFGLCRPSPADASATMRASRESPAEGTRP